MTRFADPAATAPFSFRDCACPGKPHVRDWIVLRTELGVFEAAELDALPPPVALRRLIVSWNLLDKDGQPAPITDELVALLFSDEFVALDAWVSANVRVTAIPKASGGRLRNGLTAIASRITRMIPRPA